MDTKIQQLEKLLDYRFSNRTLPLQALTHPSHLHEAGGAGDYQRLEFLGDAVLGLLLAEMLCERYPDWDEGALSQLRARLAGQDALADRARKLDIGVHIRLGKGEKHTAGRDKDSILSDVFEAVIAALYLDGGLQAARSFVLRMFDELAAAPELLKIGRDSKSELQEYLSSHNQPPPEYRLVEESGPPHDRHFSFQVLSAESVIGEGGGKSKKIAQQAAAAVALEILKSNEGLLE
ncbi:MAG: ribonuclease III [Desulfuromonadaceae bacterium]|nr:ribonuclease III [Desulfuromonadaceae bacterium]MDD2856272.1 ribonuclease III [Desulfuromonadaceae bacterium]